MESFFTAEFFRGNRQRLRQLFKGTAPIVITANGLLQRGGDNTYPFRQDSSFWYLTGIDLPDVVLVIDKDKEYLIVPLQSPNDQVFGSLPEYAALSTRSGITSVLDAKTGWKQLSTRLKRVRHVATLAPSPEYIEHYGFFTNPARAQLVKQIKDIHPEAKLLDLREHLAKMRVVKQPPELAAIQAAINITTRTIKTLRPKLAKYHHEYEIEAELTRGFRRQGALGHAFDPIVASGPNSTTLHYQANNAMLKPSGVIVLDVGAEVEHYAADITRTYALKTPTKRQREVFETVRTVQDFAMGLLKPGLLAKDYEKTIHDFMGEKLRELGLIKSITEQNVRKYYPHGTSHFLGLDVHDAGNYKEPLLADMVLTVEPGIYIPQEGLGVRIEDDVLITPKGNKVLSGRLPCEL